MPMRVLIIEDNWANMELMRYLLAAQGHQVLSAENGETGIALAGSEQPDVILCDLQLPDMEGSDVARRIRSCATPCAAPIVAVTAQAMPADRERVLGQAEFDGYFPKPIDPITFVSDIEEVFLVRPNRAI